MCSVSIAPVVLCGDFVQLVFNVCASAMRDVVFECVSLSLGVYRLGGCLRRILFLSLSFELPYL